MGCRWRRRCSGSAAARSAGLPEARSVALVSVASTLGVVVPPSLVLILLADALMRAHTEAVNATGLSVRIVNTQDIFVGALGPAALLLALTALVAWATHRNGATPAATDRSAPSLRETLTAIVALACIGTLLAAVTLGYLYAVEAAATGGVALVLWGVATRALDGARLRTVLSDTIAVTGALIALLVGATTFTLVVRAFGTDRWIAELLAALPGGAPVALAVVLGTLGVCALVLDAFELIFVVVPIVMPPLLMQVGDATWVAVLALLPAARLSRPAVRLCGDDDPPPRIREPRDTRTRTCPPAVFRGHRRRAVADPRRAVDRVAPQSERSWRVAFRRDAVR
ncbi:MAG: TRAP transporter large permease subunit [Betaproteobacteria bacterium]